MGGIYRGIPHPEVHGRHGGSTPCIYTQGGIYERCYPCIYTQGGIYEGDTPVYTPREAYMERYTPVHTQGGIHREVYTCTHPGRHTGRYTLGGETPLAYREVYLRRRDTSAQSGCLSPCVCSRLRRVGASLPVWLTVCAEWAPLSLCG